MCSRGVFQLRKLSIFFCDFGGSSNGLRQAITSQSFKNYINQNPQIEFNFICKRNHHPYVRGAYINGYIKDIPLRNAPQPQILQVLEGLKKQLGRKSYKVSGTRVYGAKESIQGKWQPNLFNKYPTAELQKVYQIPEIKLQMKEKTVEERPENKVRDRGTVMINMRQARNPHK